LHKRSTTADETSRVDYELTDLGRSLWKPVEALGIWARDHRAEIEAAKSRFDERAKTD
jgi:DNA-binding HxlR family transcriptional regulator